MRPLLNACRALPSYRAPSGLRFPSKNRVVKSALSSCISHPYRNFHSSSRLNSVDNKNSSNSDDKKGENKNNNSGKKEIDIESVPDNALFQSMISYNPMSVGNERVLYTNRNVNSDNSSNSGNTSGGESSKKESEKDDSFLYRHGAKITFFGFGFAALMIYRYIKGNSNRSDKEAELYANLALEPFEAVELRDANPHIKNPEFNVIYNAIVKSRLVSMSYREFIELVKTHLKGETIKNAYLLDRMVLKYLEMQNSSSNDLDNKLSIDSSLPVALLLLIFSLAVQESAAERYSILFKIAKLSESMAESSDDAKLGDEFVRFKFFKDLADLLMDTNQIPPEKSVVETGEEYPFVTYRQKRASDIVDMYYKNAKAAVPKDDEVLTRNEFELILKSPSACVWGECFKREKRD